MNRATKSPREIYYPDSDGKPMAESDLHRDWMVRIIELLQRFFKGQRVYVSGNLLIYYEEGNPKRCVAPDAFVVKDCEQKRRRVFLMWQEGRVPCFVLETTSPKTRREDKGKKWQLYAQLGVAEYFLYDPLGEWLEPALQGYRLAEGEYMPIPPDAEGGISSEQLGITFRLDNGNLVLFDTSTGERLHTAAEAEFEERQRRKQAESEAAEARALAAQAEAALRSLQEEVAHLRAKREDGAS